MQRLLNLNPVFGAVQEGGDAAEAIGRACVGDGADFGQDGFVLGAVVGVAPGLVRLAGGGQRHIDEGMPLPCCRPPSCGELLCVLRNVF